MGEGVSNWHRLDANTSIDVISQVTKPPIHYGTSLNWEWKAVHRTCHRPSLTRSLVCDAPIGLSRVLAGGREIEESGLPAITEFQVMTRMSDGTSVVEAVPKTGRTNQIRIHLWEMGYPIVGDPAYLPGKRRVNRQTLDLSDGPMCLHAESLRFIHPRHKEPIQLEVGLPRWASF